MKVGRVWKGEGCRKLEMTEERGRLWSEWLRKDGGQDLWERGDSGIERPG